MRSWNGWGLAALWVCGTAAAVDLPPPKVEPQRVPVSVADLGVTARLAVDRIKIALLPGDEFGHTSAGIFCAGRTPLRVSEEFIKGYGTYETSVATQLLKKYGYTMASLGSSSAFNTDVAAAPDFRIGGIVKEIKLEICRTGNEAEGWVYLKVDWALYSEKEQKVVFQLTTEGLANSSKKIPDLSRLAIVSTIENFIGAPGFLAAIKPEAAAELAARAASGAAPPVVAAKPADDAKAGDARPPVVPYLTPVKATDLNVKLAVDPVKVAMLPGDPLGNASVGGFCVGSTPLAVTDGFIKNYGNFVSTVAQQALKRNGYPLASQGKTSAFDTEQAAAPDFRLGGILKELRMEVCNGANASEGWIYAKIDWALYSEKAKRVVFQQVTEGLMVSKDKIPDLAQRALTASIENFLAAPEVLVALKAAPVTALAAAPDAAASAASGAAGAASAPTDGVRSGLQLAGGAPLAGGAQKNQARLRAAVVTLETAGGSGSGFYIDREGYLLTNFHVVSGSKFVKVKLANGDRLVAQVVKVSERDDVALLKSVAVDLDPLAIRPDTLDVGEEVYAIGTPLGVLTSTMTRGVLSADRVSQGVHELQSDAAVTFGSSGGPLLDSEGRVIGLTKGGIRGEKGFNFFVPVHDALRALEVSFTKR